MVFLKKIIKNENCFEFLKIFLKAQISLIFATVKFLIADKNIGNL